jgi:hypothetical protein
MSECGLGMEEGSSVLIFLLRLCVFAGFFTQIRKGAVFSKSPLLLRENQFFTGTFSFIIWSR